MRSVLPRYFSSTTSPFSRCLSCASFVLIHAHGSQVTLVIGFGSSCSQPLFAKLPSQIVGSGLKINSRPPAAGADAGAAGAEGAGGADAEGAGTATPEGA